MPVSGNLALVARVRELLEDPRVGRLFLGGRTTRANVGLWHARYGLGSLIRLRSRCAAGRNSIRNTELRLDLLPGDTLRVFQRFFYRSEVVLLLQLLDELFVDIDWEHDGHPVAGFVKDEAGFGQRHGGDPTRHASICLC